MGGAASAHASVGRNRTIRSLMAQDAADASDEPTAGAAAAGSAVVRVHIEPPQIEPTLPPATTTEQAARESLRQFYSKQKMTPLQVAGKVNAVMREYKGRENKVIARLGGTLQPVG